MDTNQLRNIGIIAHIDAGKTTFTERVLFYTGIIKHMGEVHDGSATMDFMQEERERGITIAAACVSCPWQEHLINIIDTPGHVDFTIEVERSLRVLDAAIGIFDAVAGVEPQSERVWKQAAHFSIPMLAVVNKMDRNGASFSATLASLQEKLGVKAAPVTIPFGEGSEFSGVLDLVQEEMLFFQEETRGKVIERRPFTEKAKEYAAPWREALIDILTEKDDELLDVCLSGNVPSASLIHKSLRLATQKHGITPIFTTSALKNIGIQPVLDAVLAYLPSPCDRSLPVPLLQVLNKQYDTVCNHNVTGITSSIPSVTSRSCIDAGLSESKEPKQKKGQCSVEAVPEKELPEYPLLLAGQTHPSPVNEEAAKQEAFCGLVFKVILEKEEKILFVRSYLGNLHKGQFLFARGKWSQINDVFRVYAEEREPVDLAFQGDIVAITGLDAETGDAITSGFHVELEPINQGSPVISMVFEVSNDEETTFLSTALDRAVLEDPTLRVEHKDGRILLSGMGELQLEVLRDRIQREYGITIRLGNPHVVCREIPIKVVEKTSDLSLEILGKKEYGKLKVRLTPVELSNDVTTKFSDLSINESIKAQMVRGIKDACSTGNYGYPVVSCCVSILELGEDVTENGAYLATKYACTEAIKECETKVEEPFMRLVITVPNDFVGSTLFLLGSCGAKIEDCIGGAIQSNVYASAQLKQLFGFATRLRSCTQGRSDLFMEFSHYASHE